MAACVHHDRAGTVVTIRLETLLKLIAACIASALLLGACATPYQKQGLTGGFTETQLSPETYRISFKANTLTSADQVQDFTLLRAAELTLENGHRYFVVQESVDQTQRHVTVVPATTYSSGKVKSSGDKAKYESYSSSSPGYVKEEFSPGLGMVIRTLDAKPAKGEAYDAAFLVKSLKTKYEIK